MKTKPNPKRNSGFLLLLGAAVIFLAVAGGILVAVYGKIDDRMRHGVDHPGMSVLNTP